MTAPAAHVAATQGIRRNHERRGEAHESPSVERLIRETDALLRGTGARLSPSKVSREVRTYVRRVAGNGVPFGDYLASVVVMDVRLRRDADSLYDRLCYSDPTGNQAARNVDRQRGGI